MGIRHPSRPKLDVQLERAIAGHKNLQIYDTLTSKIETAWQNASPEIRAKLADGSMDYETLVPELAGLKVDYAPSTITHADLELHPAAFPDDAR